MGTLRHADRYDELLAYQKARELAADIFRLSQEFPRDETFSLTSQIRRSSRAIGAQIAEAWGKRRYERHFVSKLTDADGEQQETQHWLQTAVDCGYVPAETGKQLRERCNTIGRLLSGMMAKADLFCGEPPARLRETPEEYLADSSAIPPPMTVNCD